MRGKKTKFLCTIIILAFSILVLAPGQPVARAEDDTIKLGFIADITGIGYLFAMSQIAGLEIGISELNEQGGLMGKKLKLIIRDGQLRPEIGANMARDLILKEKVDFLIGPTSSSEALAISEVAKENKKLVYFHTSNTWKITTERGHRYLFQVVPNTHIEGQAAAISAAKLPYKKYAFIGPDYSFGHTQFESFKNKLTSLKPDVEIVKELWPKLGEKDFTPYITALLADKPEIIYSNLWGDNLVGFVKQANTYELFKTVKFMGLLDLDALKSLGGDCPEGLYGYARAPFYASDTEEMKAFVEKYKAKTRDYPSDWAIMAYDGLMALASAVKKANSLDTEKVIDALEGLKWNSLRGELQIRPFDHMANCGEYVGVTYKNPDYPFLILKDVEYIPGDKVWHSIEEIKKMRGM
ncbi:MAG: ABC transporter substrate-binding protein [Deltaproteobacteria bacterium]|nr:ABC transporter substrate-binding protein [Deltaproteobacteria bacterium]